MEDKLVTVEGKFLEYKGRPLVREDNTICYGFMEDPYVLQLTIMTTKMYHDREVPDKVLIQILKTDSSLSAQEQRELKLNIQKIWEEFELLQEEEKEEMSAFTIALIILCIALAIALAVLCTILTKKIHKLEEDRL